MSLSPTDKFHKFYAIFGTLIVIVPMMALISFAFFVHGLTSDALLGNGNIEIESKSIELNVRDTIKNAEILGYIVEQHLLATEKETHSEIMSIRRTEEHAKEKEGNLKKRKERLSEIQDKLKAINKMRSKNTTDLKENGESLAKNKSLIKKAERYLNDSVWLSIFSVSVMLLGGLTAKVGFKRWNELSAADYY
ncbi:MAG: hypothetical protein E2O82_06225 [Betaproteobacteria bacterium]|nr:MAG: hypothetical protein E2O82_06225 [Betaproteobacteria bacterium]